MNVETIFRFALAALLVVYLLPRALFPRLMRRISAFDPSQDALLLVLTAVPVLLAAFAPQSMAWAGLPFPAWMRWLGAGIALINGAIFVWATAAFSRALPADEQAQRVLVTSGPYRWVRHPMYGAAVLFGLGVLLLSANWLVGLMWLAVGVGVAVARVGREEGDLRTRFGTAHRAYRLRTGLFFPDVFGQASHRGERSTRKRPA